MEETAVGLAKVEFPERGSGREIGEREENEREREIEIF